MEFTSCNSCVGRTTLGCLLRVPEELNSMLEDLLRKARARAGLALRLTGHQEGNTPGGAGAKGVPRKMCGAQGTPGAGEWCVLANCGGAGQPSGRPHRKVLAHVARSLGGINSRRGLWARPGCLASKMRNLHRAVCPCFAWVAGTTHRAQRELEGLRIMQTRMTR